MEDRQWVINLKNVVDTQVKEHDGAALFAIATAPVNEKGERATMIGWAKGESADTETRAQVFSALFFGLCAQNNVDPAKMLKDLEKIIKNKKIKEEE